MLLTWRNTLPCMNKKRSLKLNKLLAASVMFRGKFLFEQMKRYLCVQPRGEMQRKGQGRVGNMQNISLVSECRFLNALSTTFIPETVVHPPVCSWHNRTLV